MSPDTLCVHCRRRPVAPDSRPFCSERCRLLDLGNWVDERYRIPSAPADPEEPDEVDEDDPDND